MVKLATTAIHVSRRLAAALTRKPRCAGAGVK